MGGCSGKSGRLENMNNTSQSIDNYKYKGAMAMVALQEQHLKSFLNMWRKAKEKNISLPETDDENYQSLETLLFHVFRASRGYMTWICEKLNLPDPNIYSPPKINEIEKNAERYLEHLIERWRLPLRNIPEELFLNKAYTSRWGTDYCIDAMLEHAVMHPIRHEYQLSNLLDQ
jgi:uncharacterized damage-inducible protein DinB